MYDHFYQQWYQTPKQQTYYYYYFMVPFSKVGIMYEFKLESNDKVTIKMVLQKLGQVHNFQILY